MKCELGSIVGNATTDRSIDSEAELIRAVASRAGVQCDEIRTLPADDARERGQFRAAADHLVPRLRHWIGPVCGLARPPAWVQRAGRLKAV